MGMLRKRRGKLVEDETIYYSLSILGWQWEPVKSISGPLGFGGGGKGRGWGGGGGGRGGGGGKGRAVKRQRC